MARLLFFIGFFPSCTPGSPAVFARPDHAETRPADMEHAVRQRRAPHASLPAQRAMRAGSDDSVHPRARMGGAVDGESDGAVAGVELYDPTDVGVDVDASKQDVPSRLSEIDGRIDVRGQVLFRHDGHGRVPVRRLGEVPVADDSEPAAYMDLLHQPADGVR
ncbi:hypothetical protein [Streptomyces sp. NPDC003393]